MAFLLAKAAFRAGAKPLFCAFCGLALSTFGLSTFALSAFAAGEASLRAYCNEGGKIFASPDLIQIGPERWQAKPPLRDHGHDWRSGLFAHRSGKSARPDVLLRLRLLPEDLIIAFPDGTQIRANRCP